VSRVLESNYSQSRLITRRKRPIKGRHVERGTRCQGIADTKTIIDMRDRVFYDRRYNGDAAVAASAAFLRMRETRELHAA
jgi:hypothetical protein